MRVINSLGGGLPAERLDRAVQRWWPALQEELNEILERMGKAVETAKPQRDSIDMLAELLELTRGLQRELQTVESGSQQGATSSWGMSRIPITGGMPSNLHSALVKWSEGRGQKRAAVRVEHSSFGQGRVLDVLQGVEGTIRLRVRFNAGPTRVIPPNRVKLVTAPSQPADGLEQK
jgi:hypothetical protein